MITSKGKKIFLKAHDSQGLLWAISSLNQMIRIHNQKSQVRLVQIVDWPKTLQRGFLGGSGIGNKPEIAAHFMVAFKFNLVDFRGEITKDKEHHDNWRLPRSDIFYKRIKGIGERFKALGFQWYAGDRFLGYDQVPQINCSSETDFNIIYKNFALPIAEAGGNLSVQFDDTRYPLHPDDKKKFGTAAKADHYFLTKLYEKLQKDYPDIRIAFCPPLYWGPVAPNPHPESRDTYLNLIGTLPKAIDIYWTGPSVRSGKVLPEYVKWEVDRIKRKPLVFQNGIGIPHAYNYHYITDPVYKLNKWYYEGYLEDIRAYMLNGGDIDNSGVLVSIADWTWNPGKFDPEAVIKDSAMKLAGPESYQVLRKINSELSRFDPYLPDVSLKAVADSSFLYKVLDNLETLAEETEKINGKSIEFWTGIYQSHISRVERLVKNIRQASLDPVVKLLAKKKNASINMYYAVKEAGFNPDTEIFLAPETFIGGGGPFVYGYVNEKDNIRVEDRSCVYICGAKTPISEMSAGFEIEHFPTSGNYQLIISAADDFLKEKCPIKLTVNGNILYEGPNPFSNKRWNVKKFKLPANMLKRNNILTISNTSPTANFDAPPAFLLNYAFLRELAK